MISGRQTLEDIRRAFREERARLGDIDRRLEAANERLVALDAARADQLAALARTRVGKAAGDGAAAAQGSDARVAAMLESRRAARAKLAAELAELDAKVTRLEGERESLADALEAATEALDDAEAASQARLEQDAGYQARLERAYTAERTARSAAEKAAQSEKERVQKGRAYENDPLFMYLWRRGYGTREYRAWGLTRWLDRKVARLISFDAARANYARLIELPVRLREHAEAMADAAEEAIAELRRLDEKARAADGVEALEQTRDAADEALERHDKALAEAEAARQEAFERLERMDRGEDEAYTQMVAFLASELARDDLQALRRQALATPLPEDDAVVARLLELEAERERLAETVEDLKEASAGSRARVRELQTLMRDFTARRYDAPGSGFPDEDLVMTMLSQFLRGAATREILWRVLEGQRRAAPRHSSPTFGSGGFGRGSPWSGGGRVGGARPSAGSLKGGGFRTGGSIARGGFRTGGKKR